MRCFAHLVRPAIPRLGDTVTTPPAGHTAVMMLALDVAVTMPRSHRSRTSTVNVYRDLGSSTCAGANARSDRALTAGSTTEVTSTTV
jgi:hypothetical protein